MEWDWILSVCNQPTARNAFMDFEVESTGVVKLRCEGVGHD